MIIDIHAKGMQLTDEEREYIETKMEKITQLAKRMKDESSVIRVEIHHDKTKSKEDEITCIITITIPKDTLRSEVQASIVTEAVDKAKKMLIPQIEKYKEKFSGH